MEKRVEKIVINPQGIDVISSINGVNSVTQLNLEPQENEAKEIFEQHNLNTLTNYPFDMKIVRALSENEEQLKDYLETCRRANYSNGKIEVPESIPEIEYDLRDLKNGFEEISDEDLRKSKQIEMYKQAKETQNTLKSAKGKVKVDIGRFYGAYLQLQEFLQTRNQKPLLALEAGHIEPRKNIREELYNETYTARTNEVSREYALQEKENQQEQKITKDVQEELAK